MTKHICDLTAKAITPEETNYGRVPLVVPVSDKLSVHLQFVDAQGRCCAVDISKAAMPKVLEQIAEHVKKPAAAPVVPKTGTSEA